MKSYFTAVLAGVSLALAAPRALATSIYDASFDSTGALITSGTFTLDNYVVVGIYYNYTAFIYDGTAYGRIYSSSLVPTLTVGSVYSDTSISSTPYYNYPEFTSATGATLVSSDNIFDYISIADLSVIASTAALGASPSAGNNYELFNAPVTFTFTPTADTTLNTGGSSYISDAGGTQIQFYRSVSATTLVAGQTYTVTGYVQTYSGLAEIVGASFVAVPEPATVTMLILGSGTGLLLLWRQRQA